MYSFFEWLKKVQNEEMMTAAPATKPITVPTTKPKPSGPPVPWKPVNPPLKQPKAKDEKKKLILHREVYERDVDSYVRQFASNLIRNKDNPLGKNPLTAMSGEKLIKRGYETFRPQFDEAGYSTDQMQLMRRVFGILNDIKRIESRHRKKLEQAAVELAAKHTGFPEEVFHAYLNREPEQGGSYVQQQMNPPKKELAQMTDNLRHHINRRINMNLLSQGHALHIMDEMHMEIKDILEKIDPSLPRKYKELSVGTKGTYYFTQSIQAAQEAANRADATVGEVEIDTNPETEQPEIYATGQTFPFLLQELIKGAMDMAAGHAFEGLSEKEKNTVTHHADRFEDEPWHFIMGVPLWHDFLKLVPKEYKGGPELFKVVAQLAHKDPKFVNQTLQDAIEDLHGGHDPAKFQQVVHDLMDEYRQHESGESEWSPDNEDEDEDQEYETR